MSQYPDDIGKYGYYPGTRIKKYSGYYTDNTNFKYKKIIKKIGIPSRFFVLSAVSPDTSNWQTIL